MSAPLIYQKISAILRDVSAIAKDSRNAQQGFNYRGIDEFYNELNPLFAKHGVFTTTEVLEEKREDATTKSGGALKYSILKIKFTFFAEDGSSVPTVVIGEGMDSGDKASNKAMAVGHKYALMQIFAIPTKEEKDPDGESHELGSSGASESIGKAPTDDGLKYPFPYPEGFKGTLISAFASDELLLAESDLLRWKKKSSYPKNGDVILKAIQARLPENPRSRP